LIAESRKGDPDNAADQHGLEGLSPIWAVTQARVDGAAQHFFVCLAPAPQIAAPPYEGRFGTWAGDVEPTGPDLNEAPAALGPLILDNKQLAMLWLAVGGIHHRKLALAQVRFGTVLGGQEGGVFGWQRIEYREGAKFVRSTLGDCLGAVQGGRFDSGDLLGGSRASAFRRSTHGKISELV
jgi:hypothetical protein